MKETGIILQAVLVFITIVLLTLAIFSRRIFQSINTRYILFTGAGITVVCIFFLESVLSHYLLKFYHFAGWNGYFLFLFCSSYYLPLLFQLYIKV